MSASPAPTADAPRPVHWNWPIIGFFVGAHGVALYGLFGPKEPMWIPLAVGVYFALGLSTTIALHRLLSHKSFKCPKWLEYLWVSVAVTTGQGSPLLWVANHRQHHADSDGPTDVHSPTRGFWYGHIGWICDDHSTRRDAWRSLCPDLAGDRYYHWLIPYRMVPQALAVLLVGLTLGWRAVPFVFYLPAVLWMHATYCVNSVGHTPSAGFRTFKTPPPDLSRNVWWVGLIAMGEGWHNNHHAFPRAAFHGFGWRQIDFSAWTLRLLAKVGLVWDLQQPTPAMIARALEQGVAAPSPTDVSG